MSEINGIALFLQGAVRHFADGKAANFARMLGVGNSALYGWLHGDHIPSFPQLVKIALTCGCSIADVLEGNRDVIHKSGLIKPKIVNPLSSRRKAAPKLNIKSLGKRLQVLAAEEPPISVARATTKLGVSSSTLYVHFGEIVRGMTRRLRTHMQDKKKLRFEYKCRLYRQSSEKLIHHGKRPTSRLVALDLKDIETVCKKEQREACARICREVIESFSKL
jgi:hypothetical protein